MNVYVSVEDASQTDTLSTFTSDSIQGAIDFLADHLAERWLPLLEAAYESSRVRVRSSGDPNEVLLLPGDSISFTFKLNGNALEETIDQAAIEEAVHGLRLILGLRSKCPTCGSENDG